MDGNSPSFNLKVDENVEDSLIFCSISGSY